MKVSASVTELKQKEAAIKEPLKASTLESSKTFKVQEPKPIVTPQKLVLSEGAFKAIPVYSDSASFITIRTAKPDIEEKKSAEDPVRVISLATADVKLREKKEAEPPKKDEKKAGGVF